MPTPAPSLKSFAKRAWRALNRPEVAVLLEADNLLVKSPEAGAVWTAGSTQSVAWHVVGPAGDVVDVELVTMDGTRSRTVAVLATGINTREGGVGVTVPDRTPGEYRVLVTSSHGVLDAYSGPITLRA